jgi:hypothetical protein
MARIRKPARSAFLDDYVYAPEPRLAQALASEPLVGSEPARTSHDPMKFVRAMVEIERARKQRIHPESPTLH